MLEDGDQVVDKINNIPLSICYTKNNGQIPSLTSFERSGGTHTLGILALMCKDIQYPHQRIFASHYLDHFEDNPILDRTFLVLRHPIYCMVSLWEFMHKSQGQEIKWHSGFWKFLDRKLELWMEHTTKVLSMFKVVIRYEDMILRKLEASIEALRQADMNPFKIDELPLYRLNAINEWSSVNPHYREPYKPRNLNDCPLHNSEHFLPYYNQVDEYLQQNNLRLTGM